MLVHRLSLFGRHTFFGGRTFVSNVCLIFAPDRARFATCAVSCLFFQFQPAALYAYENGESIGTTLVGDTYLLHLTPQSLLLEMTQLVYSRPTISFIVFVVAPTSVVLLLIFVEEMHGEWALIPYASHLLLVVGGVRERMMPFAIEDLLGFAHIKVQPSWRPRWFTHLQDTGTASESIQHATSIFRGIFILISIDQGYRALELVWSRHRASPFPDGLHRLQQPTAAGSTTLASSSHPPPPPSSFPSQQLPLPSHATAHQPPLPSDANAQLPSSSTIVPEHLSLYSSAKTPSSASACATACFAEISAMPVVAELLEDADKVTKKKAIVVLCAYAGLQSPRARAGLTGASQKYVPRVGHGHGVRRLRALAPLPRRGRGRWRLPHRGTAADGFSPEAWKAWTTRTRQPPPARGSVSSGGSRMRRRGVKQSADPFCAAWFRMHSLYLRGSVHPDPFLGGRVQRGGPRRQAQWTVDVAGKSGRREALLSPPWTRPCTPLTKATLAHASTGAPSTLQRRHAVHGRDAKARQRASTPQRPVNSDPASPSAPVRGFASAPGRRQTSPRARQRPVTVAEDDDDRHSTRGRVTLPTVLDHLLLFQGHRDARCDLLNAAITSPTPLIACSRASPSSPMEHYAQTESYELGNGGSLVFERDLFLVSEKLERPPPQFHGVRIHNTPEGEQQWMITADLKGSPEPPMSERILFSFKAYNWVDGLAHALQEGLARVCGQNIAALQGSRFAHFARHDTMGEPMALSSHPVLKHHVEHLDFMLHETRKDLEQTRIHAHRAQMALAQHADAIRLLAQDRRSLRLQRAKKDATITRLREKIRTLEITVRT
ncbi:hypothetical protein QYE76_056864 [Lolium multiflorum]|uniref:Uncharacterized protein n=1 Tax=Lolium multiflorum TaxID=4521 RepID=A0AAD8T3B4_LOLMU|nr:hypothetical protein QYE76_056864 [Lolium multiflorum]